MRQAIVLKRMKEFEEQVCEAIPDFDVPRIEPMREPILDCSLAAPPKGESIKPCSTAGAI